MKRRKEINDNIVNWIVHKVRTEYADDVSLVLIYGSYVNGTANNKSDVDCYFIPRSERGYHLAVDFIIDGVGYDIFPMSWERVEKIADLHDNLSPLVGDASIIYSNSADDVERFKSMQTRLKNHLENDEYVRQTAKKRCEQAGRLLAMLNQSHNASEVRKEAGLLLMVLADAVAVYHHDYFHFGLKKQFEDLQNHIPNIPPNIVEGYQNIVKAGAIEDVRKCAITLYEDICAYLDVTVPPQEISEPQKQSANNINAPWLASLYEEISSTFQKIYVCCETGNYILAFLSAVCLQRELDDAKEAGCPGYELLSDFNYRELYKLSQTVQKTESDFVQLIREHGGHIRQYDSFEQFQSAKL